MFCIENLRNELTATDAEVPAVALTAAVAWIVCDGDDSGERDEIELFVRSSWLTLSSMSAEKCLLLCFSLSSSG